MTDSQKLDLLLGKIAAMEKEVEELRFCLRDIVRENVRLKKKCEMTNEDSASEKCLEDIKRIAEGKKIYHCDTEL